jgi:CheY-like chemotaxis protein
LDIRQVLRDSAALAASGTNVRCQFELSEERWAVMGDEGQLAQVFQNLVRNAVDAMPSGGTVQVRLFRQLGSGGDEICVEITDHGQGIAPELLDKIFVPFFSTKNLDSGLGLAVAYSIVQHHAGHIQVSSQVGVGTTFRVSLPALGGWDATSEAPRSKPRGSGRVLVMDDEPIVLQVTDRALHSAGYDVRTVTNGGDAIEAYREALADGRRFDAVILDLTVPAGIGGKEAAERILAIDPTARLMVSSGYSEDSVMSEYRRHGFCAVLPKPYSARQLCDALVAMLPTGRTEN